MTLPYNDRVSDTYTANGVLTDFNFDFRVFFNSDSGNYGLEVRKLITGSYEVIDPALYEIIPNSNMVGGKVRFAVAPESGIQLYIAGNTAAEQQLHLTNFGRFAAESIEKQFDLVTAIIQEWISGLTEEARQRIENDLLLKQHIEQRMSDYIAVVDARFESKWTEISDYLNAMLPMFFCIMRKEIEAFTNEQLPAIIDQRFNEVIEEVRADAQVSIDEMVDDLTTQTNQALSASSNATSLLNNVTSELNEKVPQIDSALSKAEIAATAIAVSGNVFETPEAGVDPVTGVADGAYFNVRSSNNESYVDEYQNVGGSAVATGKSYPSNRGVEEKIKTTPKPANTIIDASGKDQQLINDSIAVKFLRADEIGLVSWDNPDKMPPYTQQEYEQAYNNGIRLAQAVVDSSNNGHTQAILETGNYPFVYQNLIGSSDFNKVLVTGSADIRGVTNFTLDFNKSKIFTIFDSNNKNPYDTSPSSFLPYQLPGTLFTLYDSRGLTFKNGLLKGDQYKRSWVAGENTREQTYGMLFHKNNRNIRFENMKFTGFRGDGVHGKPRGTVLENYTMYEWSKGDIDASGNVVALAGAYSSARVDLRTKTIIDNMVQLEAHADRLLTFRNNLLKVSFFKADNSLISQETTAQSLDITLPKDCAFIQFTAFNDERTTDTVTYSTLNYGTALASGGSKGFYFDERCEFYENHRGGVSNLGGDTLFFGSKFRDMGLFSKLGFPHYGDPTQYAINFEDTYTSSLTVDSIRVTNVGQGVLSNSREFTVKNSKFIGMQWGGVNNYSCVEALVEGNTFSGFREQTSGAISFSTSNNQAQSFAKISKNTLNGASISINISNKQNMKVDIDGNTVNKGRWVLIGNGKNLSSTNNHIMNVVGSGPNAAAFYEKDLLKSEGNILSGTPDAISNIYIEHNAKLGGINSIALLESRFIVNNSGDDNLVKNFGGVELLRESTSEAVLTLWTGDKTSTNTVDKWSLYDIKFKDVVLSTRLGGLRDYRDSNVEIADCKFSGSGRVRLAKNESMTTGKSTYIIKDSRFDCDNIPSVFENIYTLKGTCEIIFLNCEFISTTEKSMPLVRAVGSATTSGITSRAIGCKFVNVINTDTITVVS